MFVEGLAGGLPAEGFTGSTVECCGDSVQVVPGVSAEIGAFGEVLTEQTVGVLVGSTLPWCLGVAEVDIQIGIYSQLRVLGHLGSLVPGQRTAQLMWQGGDRLGDRVSDGLGAMTGKRGPVLDPLLLAVAWHAGKMQQHREPRRALNKRPDRGTLQSEDQVAFPVSWHCPVVGLGRTLGDHDLGTDELAAPPLGPRPWDSQRSPGSQTSHQLASESSSTLHVERLVDGFVRNSHGLIMGEIDPEPLLRSALGSTSLPTVDPFVAHDGDRPTALGDLAPACRPGGR